MALLNSKPFTNCRLRFLLLAEWLSSSVAVEAPTDSLNTTMQPLQLTPDESVVADFSLGTSEPSTALFGPLMQHLEGRRFHNNE
jgi:hypothetical protein